MNEIVENKMKIEDKIHEIRKIHVIVDRDLAKIYDVETKQLMQQVRRNIERFPQRYMFQMTDEEFRDWKSHFVTSNSDRMGLRRPPYCFTEQGAYMVSSIIKNERAVQTSINIMDAFVAMKKYISKDLIENDTVLVNHEKRILKLEESLDKLSEKRSLNSIIYEGQIYDAYSVLIDILNEANNSIIIIDNYANKELFDILRDYDKNIIVISKNLSEVLIKKYSNQYSNIRFINNNDFHDRYIILDNKTVYSSGMSFKDIGKKYTFINKVVEQFFVDDLIKKVDDIVLNKNVIES